MSQDLLNFDTLPDSAFARQAQLIPAVVPVSHATLWRWVKSGRFPKPVKLSPAVTAWKVGDVRRFLAQQGGAQ
jgi:predicted DNA-binding transcriptional regulator AlpA